MATQGKAIALAVLVVGLGWRSQSPAAVMVTAGTATAIEGDYEINSQPLTYQFVDDTGPEYVVNVVLDIGSAKWVDKIVNVNRFDIGTALNAKDAQILVAADESAGGFNPSLSSSFTVPVFSGTFTPADFATPGLRRYADIADVNRRYFLINYTSNFAGTLDGTANFDRVHVGDLDVVLGVPEPSIAMLLGLGGLLVWRRGWEIRNPKPSPRDAEGSGRQAEARNKSE